MPRWLTRDRAITLAFVALAFALAIWQRPGWATSDTKIDLYVDPVRFLSSVASVWTSTTDLGEVHSAQYSGYLWPMGPFFAVGHLLGIGAWLIERIWLGLLYALSAWGMLRLLDALFGRRRRALHVVGTAFFLLNPYVVVFSARTSITLLGYAALPWLLLITHRGLHSEGGWRGLRRWMWAAVFALVLTSTGGGVNAAVVGWMLVGPLVLLLYEPAIGAVRWRDTWTFLLQAGVFGVLVSLWWIVPLLVHVRYGIDFLQFTEQPASIWATNSITESLRLMGYWTSYIGVGFGVTRPYFSDGGILLFSPFVVGASLLLPALALAGFAAARRLSYTPLMLALVIVGVLIMTAGFPAGTPLRGAMLWIYQHVFVLRFARTTNKAAPLVAVGLGGLLGVGADALVVRLRALTRVQQRRLALGGVGAMLTALLVLVSLPLIKGQAIDTQIEWKRIPAAWRNAGKGLDRTLAANTRALVLPGQIFAFYTWGGTLDAILPRLTSRPVAVRYETPYSNLHAVDLLTTTDDLVQQRRLVPGELAPLLNLMGVGAVVTGSDDDISRSGAIDPAAAAGVLSEQLGSHLSARYGPTRSFPPAAGDVGSSVSLPEVRRYNTSTGRGIVQVDPLGDTTIVDGSAEGLADLGAFGGLPSRSAIFYAGDLSKSQIRAQAAAGANLVVTDTNRKQEFVPQSTQQNLGPTLSAAASLPATAAVINPFVNAGIDGQTVAVLRGARFVYAPTEAGELQFPEHAPIAAFDGSLSTSWVADRYLPVSDRWVEIGLNSPRNIPYVDVYPLSGSHGVVTEVDVNGIHQHVHAGWNRIEVNLHAVSVVRVTIDNVVQPHVGLGGPGGFREIRIPGVHVTQLLRPPVLVGRDLAGTNLQRDSLTFVFERVTGDDPFRRNPYGTTAVLDKPQDRGDGETYLDRLVYAPATRSYSAHAWLYPQATTPDSTLDRVAGYTGSDRFDSSARFQDQPAYRASSAFTGRADPGWIGIWEPGEAPSPWISWSTAKPLTIRRLQLLPPGLPVRRPTVVSVSWNGGSTPPLRVAIDGTVTLPSAIHVSTVRLTVLAAAFPAGATARERSADAVGIGTVSIPGLASVSIPASGPLHASCGTASVQVAGRALAMVPEGTVQELDAGLPLRARSCGPNATMTAGVNEVRALPGPFSIDLLELHSPAPTAPAKSTGGGTVLNPGNIGQSTVSGARVALAGRSWLVLGESYDIGWRASCNGRSLGVPQVIDGYANGWLAPADCRQVNFSFAPQSGVEKSYVISALAAAALILLLLVGSWRLRGRPAPVPAPRVLPSVRPRPLPLYRAAALALVLSIPVALFFALRAGAGAFPMLTLVLWRGWDAGRLTRIAVFLLGLVVPIVYAVVSPINEGGYDFGYSPSLITAHWVGVAAILLLTVALYGTIAATRARGGGPPPVSPIDEADQHRVGPVEQEAVRS